MACLLRLRNDYIEQKRNLLVCLQQLLNMTELTEIHKQSFMIRLLQLTEKMTEAPEIQKRNFMIIYQN